MGNIPFHALLENGVYLLLIIFLAPFLGIYIYRIFDPTKAAYSKFERFCYRICGINPSEKMDWISYFKALIAFNFIGFLFLFLILCFQSHPKIPLLLAFNIAVSFATNTNCQYYAGETTLNHFSQMAGLTVQNFFNAATGFTVFLVLARSFRNAGTAIVGNFWCDLLRTILFLLLPLSILVSLIFVQQGVIQTLNPSQVVETLEKNKQLIPLGPVASQEAIKQLGSNGGGFFKANSAHPFANPTPLTNLLGSLSMILIPAASCFAFGLFIESKWDSVVIFFVMLLFLAVGIFLGLYFEFAPLGAYDNHFLFEGKEWRNGISGSIFWNLSSAATSNGSINASLISFTPLTKGLTLFYILLRETIFGEVGLGISLFIMFIFLAASLAGLLAGHTPTYIGKKIEKREVLLALAAILIPSICLLISLMITSFFPSMEGTTKGIRPWFYAFSSTITHEGLTFNNLSDSQPIHELALSALMIIGRLSVVIPVLAVAGCLSQKMKVSKTENGGLLTTTRPTFCLLLVITILFLSLYPYLPFLLGGPIREHIFTANGSFH